MSRALDDTLDGREDRAIDTCLTCPRLCRWACPVAESEARETSTPWNLMVTAGRLKAGRIPVDKVQQLPYLCTHCGACTEVCLHKNDVPFWLSLARNRIVEGHAAPEAAHEVRGHFGVAGNPYGQSLEAPLREAVEKAHGPRSEGPLASGAQVYFPGCSTLAELPEAAVGFLQALGNRGISGVAVTSASSGCCGLPLLWAGDLDAFRAHAQRQAALLSGADLVIAQDPACAHAFKVRYAQFGIKFEPDVVHTSAFLASHLGIQDERAVTEERSGEGTIAYADTCMMARGLRLVRTPRRLIQQVTGQVPIELPGLRGLEAECCGAQGLLPQTAPRTARAMAEARIDAFRSTGAERLIVASPRCAAHLRSVDPGLDVQPLASLMAKLS